MRTANQSDWSTLNAVQCQTSIADFPNLIRDLLPRFWIISAVTGIYHLIAVVLIIFESARHNDGFCAVFSTTYAGLKRTVDSRLSKSLSV